MSAEYEQLMMTIADGFLQ